MLCSHAFNGWNGKLEPSFNEKLCNVTLFRLCSFAENFLEMEKFFHVFLLLLFELFGTLHVETVILYYLLFWHLLNIFKDEKSHSNNT